MNKLKFADAKKELKTIKILYVPYRKLRRIFNEISFVLYIISTRRLNIFRRNKFRIDNIPKQKAVEIELGSMPDFENFLEMTGWLRANNIEFYEGGHTIYLPPQPVLRELLYPLLSLYPDDAGLKILKDFKKPEESSYVSRDIKKNHPKTYGYVLGRPAELLRIANYLFLNKIGTKIYDLVEVKIKNKSYTAYVIQHIYGGSPNANECYDFLQMLEQEFQKKIIMPINRGWRKHMDFCCPDCNGNIIKGKANGKLYYIDFQAFIFRDEKRYLAQVIDKIRGVVHFGKKHLIRGGSYLYQSVFNAVYGKRDTSFRWSKLKEMLDENNIDLKGKIIFDIGCNSAMMLHCALADGAFWGIGWDRQDIARSADLLLSALGDTRYNIFGVNISEKTDFSSFIPSHLKNKTDVILLFLAMRTHVGFPSGIRDLPFKYILYEGHQNETISDAKNFIKEIEKTAGYSLLRISEYKDGDSGIRPIALLKNNKLEIMPLKAQPHLFKDIVSRHFKAVRLKGTDFYLEKYLFQGIPLQDRRVLDVGSGTGLISVYLACKGAKEVVSLDSDYSKMKVLKEIIARHNLPQIVADNNTFQNFDSREKFDIILFHNSLNHLDEEACKRLKFDMASQRKYESIFKKINYFCHSGSFVIITDVSRYNLFSLLRIKNPFCPSIEWQKHQSPNLWWRFLKDAGFGKRHLKWVFYNRTGEIGKLLCANKICAFLHQGKFILIAQQSSHESLADHR
jgi:2-polyprenyl-3-methyl-5-hydroxy-6-metoxy-1,4-benzoquinol methylase